MAVVERGGLGAGARAVGVAQPNASRMIAKLEKQCRTRLLDRRPGGAVPTREGQEVVRRARELLDAAGDFSRWMEGRAHSLRVGASFTVADSLLPRWLAQLRQEDTDPVALTVGNSTRVLEELHAGHLDLGFVECPGVPRWAHSKVVHHDELLVVVSPAHPWAGRQGVSREELEATPLVVREQGSGTRRVLERAVAVTAAQELTGNTAVRVAAAAGAGPAVLSRLVVAAQLASGELVEVQLRDVKLERRFRAVWTGPRQLSGRAGQLLRVARSLVEPTPQ